MGTTTPSTAVPLPRGPVRRFSITREGGYWLLGALALIVIGLVKGINLLTLLGCLLVVLWGLNALTAGRRLRQLRVVRRLDGPVFARTSFQLQLDVTNTARAAQLGVRLEDVGELHALAWFVSRLGGRETVRLRREAVLPRRGRYAWDALRASSGHPFGLTRRSVNLAGGEATIVLPQLGRLHRGRLRRYLSRAGASSGRALQHARRHPTTQAEFHGLRAFRSGDSPRLIHWRTSARCGELMVREFEDLLSDDLIVVVDLSNPRPRLPDADAVLEDAISLAATVCWECCRQKGDRFVLAVAGSDPAVLEGTTSLEHALRMLECLALQTGGPLSGSKSGRVAGASEYLSPGHSPLPNSSLELALATVKLPAAPVLLICAGSGSLGEALAERLNRPVVRLDASALADLDFYERPTNHES